MKIKRIFIAVALVAISTFTVGVAYAASASAAPQAGCSVGDQGLAMGNSGNIVVSGTTATVTFRVNGANCSTPVSVASWIRVTPEGINDQKLYAHNTGTFGPGLHRLTVNVPQCMYQVDLIDGAHYTAADGTANYQYQNGQFVDGGLRDFVKGGTGTCEGGPEVCPYDETMPKDSEDCVPPTPEKPEKPTTITNTTTNTVNNVINSESAAAPVSAVPSTGPASILGATVGVSSIGGLSYNLLDIRRKLKAFK